jgi:hypothetical protein
VLVAVVVATADGLSRGYYLWGAVAVSLGTLAVVLPLAVRSGGVVGVALGFGPVAWLGAISYGVYLWHWPMALWLHARDVAGQPAPLLNKLAAAAGTVVVAAASYVLVERPIRHGLSRGRHAGPVPVRSAGRVLIAVPIVLVLVAGVSFAATITPDLGSGRGVVMMVGDSVPLRLRYTLEAKTSDLGVRYVSAAFGGCPVSGETPAWPEGTQMGVSGRCPPNIAQVQDGLIVDAQPDVIVWSDRFSIAGFFRPDGSVMQTGTPAFWTYRERTLDATVQRLTRSGATVLLLAIEPPSLTWETTCDGIRVEDCRWRTFLVEHPDLIRTWNAMLAAYAQAHPDLASFLNLAATICHDDDVPCDDRIGGVSARPDGTHYEGAGADLAARLVWARLRTLLPGGA